MTTHKYKVGQMVGFAGRGPVRAPRGDYKVVAQLPADGRGPQYRVKNKAEPHERIAPEDELTASGSFSG
ncbi:hypothetical protein [Thalassobaculum sp.]|jgi:hypothetical protein|uniref:hypothetical protein n=1 Tax=Thalassobaculum sp. TaxID=2022740 RepID=UPI00015F0168|nr:hypothetical protein BAL199_17033 [alpha proteobacterium BAL199]